MFAEIPTPPAGTLALGSDKTVPLFGVGSAEPAANRSAIIEFIVDDVDAEYARLRPYVGEVVTEPTTMPWGQSGAAVPRPGRKPGEPVHPGHGAGARQIRAQPNALTLAPQIGRSTGNVCATTSFGGG